MNNAYARRLKSRCKRREKVVKWTVYTVLHLQHVKKSRNPELYVLHVPLQLHAPTNGRLGNFGQRCSTIGIVARLSCSAALVFHLLPEVVFRRAAS